MPFTSSGVRRGFYLRWHFRSDARCRRQFGQRAFKTLDDRFSDRSGRWRPSRGRRPRSRDAARAFHRLGAHFLGFRRFLGRCFLAAGGVRDGGSRSTGVPGCSASGGGRFRGFGVLQGKQGGIRLLSCPFRNLLPLLRQFAGLFELGLGRAHLLLCGLCAGRGFLGLQLEPLRRNTCLGLCRR